MNKDIHNFFARKDIQLLKHTNNLIVFFQKSF